MQAVLDCLKKDEDRFVARLCGSLRFSRMSAQPRHIGAPLQTALLALAVLLTAGCSSPQQPTAGRPTNFDVILVPTEEFPTAEATKVGTTVANDTGLRIKTVLPLGTRDWKPFPDRPQYDPIALMALAVPAIERLKSTYGGRVYVILTVRDLGPADKSLNFVFSQHDHVQKMSVISAAQMLFDQQGNKARPELIQARLHKMLLRTVALQYYGLQRSTDIQDVTYAPLMSVADLDQMGLRLNTK